MTDVQALRQQIESDLADQNWSSAFHGLNEFWRSNPTPAAANFVTSRTEKMRGHWPFATCRLAILRSFTVEPLVPMLRASALVGGIDLAIQVGEFNAYAQEIFDRDSQLYSFAPNAVILAVQTRDIAPEIWRWSATESNADLAIQRTISAFDNLISSFRQNSQAHLIIHNLELPEQPSQGVLDTQSASGQAEAIRLINRELLSAAAKHLGVYVLDYNELAARFGRTDWHDERRWLTTRLPIASGAMKSVVDEWLRFLHPISGKVCKALAVDLDNTLWGGVIGEDGIEGLELGQEYPGAGYQSLQQAILDLYDRGVILAICSKNNYSDAMAAIEKHPGMLLRPQHFAAVRINWNDKAQGLREIASELNIGLDSIAFLDDNPAERALVRTELPQVSVIELPKEPLNYARTLRACPLFERLIVSAEDRERGRYYSEQHQRAEMQQAMTSLEDFYRSLEQEVEINPATPQTISRIAQLTQKTNQFNLTTRRYTEQQIAELAGDPNYRIYAARVRDRFGDHGLVGVAIIKIDRQAGAPVWAIETLLLSCRVIGRTVETAILSFIANEAGAAGAQQLRGSFISTNKNAPAKDFYASHNFHLVAEDEKQAAWVIDLNSHGLKCPAWIKLKSQTLRSKQGSPENV